MHVELELHVDSIQTIHHRVRKYNHDAVLGLL